MERFYTCIFWWIFLFCLYLLVFLYVVCSVCLCVSSFFFSCSIRREISNSYSFTFTLRIDIAEFSIFLNVVLFVFFSYFCFVYCVFSLPLAADMRCVADLYSSYFLPYLIFTFSCLQTNFQHCTFCLKCVRLFFSY